MNNKHKVSVAFSAILALMLVGSASGKLLQSEQMKALFESHGLAGWLVIIGLGELLSLIAFLVPKTRALGALLLSAYFGGAIVLHMSHAEPFVVPAGILLLVWLTSWLRGDWQRGTQPA